MTTMNKIRVFKLVEIGIMSMKKIKGFLARRAERQRLRRRLGFSISY